MQTIKSRDILSDIYKPSGKKIKTVAATALLTMFAGFIYVALFGEWHPHAIINALIIGLLIGVIGSAAEVYFFQKIGKRLVFSVLLVSRTLFYVIMIGTVIIVVIVYHVSMMHSISFFDAFEQEDMKNFFSGGEFIRIFFYALFFSFMINFIRQINKLLGQNVLLKYITGKYHKPVEEERIFMFLDIDSSTTIAEKLGNILYHKFLNDFFYDITPAVIKSKGEIYQYVGDEVVISWTKNNGLSNANCINCYLHIIMLINLQEERYRERYGIVPRFKAGYHFGKVITGEIGDIKKEIVFHGDTVNTAARIRSECSNFKKNLLLSGDLLNKLKNIDYLSPESIGKIRLRGKEEEIELFSFLEAA